MPKKRVSRSKERRFILSLVLKNVVATIKEIIYLLLENCEDEIYVFSGGPLLVPKMKYLVELMIIFSTRQMGYFDMLQSENGFRPITYRLRHTASSIK